MKKIILLVTVAVAVAGTSCRKTRTCECSTVNTTVTTFGSTSSTTTTTEKNTHTMDNQKKAYFKTTSACYNTKSVRSSTFTGGSSVTTDETSCTLK